MLFWWGAGVFWGFDGVFADGCRVLVFSGRSGVGVGEGGEVVEEGGAKVRGSGDFKGAAVPDDGVDDVLIASSSDIAVVQADVGGFTTFSGVVYATALVGCGEGFEGFPIGGVVGGVDAPAQRRGWWWFCAAWRASR